MDVPRTAAPSRPQGGEAVGVPGVPDMSDEGIERGTPSDRSARGLLPEWDAFELHDQLLRAIHHQSFMKPTPIQSKALPPALQGRDVVAVAETVRDPLHQLSSNTYVGNTGIGKNSCVWIARPTQTPLTEEAPSPRDPQTSACVDPSPHSRTRTPNIIALKCLPKRY